MIPQIIWLCLLFGAFVLACAKHGEDKGKYSWWASLIASILSFLLVYWGGFFEGLF